MAALVTLGLFAFMASMIKQEPTLETPRKNEKITILAKIDPTVENPIEFQPIEKLPEPPPPVQNEWKTDGNPENGFKYTPPTEGIQGPGKIGPQTQFQGAVVQTAPFYPEGCRGRNASGSVLVQFDVTPEGNVINARIIESADRCFNRTVIRAVSGWKYAPSYQNGTPVARRGVVEAFRFELVE